MIIIQLAGGLGNQMQQYALYQKFLSLSIPAKLDASWFEEEERQKQVYAKRLFELCMFENITFELCTEAEKTKLIGSDSVASKLKKKLLPCSNKLFTEAQMYEEEIFSFRDKYICGYFACEKYYEDILSLLRKKFVFPESTNPKNKRTTEDMAAKESVSIHVRRGDYLDAINQDMFGGICTEAYYEGAIAYIKKRHPQAHFYIFSDDIDYVKEKYTGDEFSVVDWNTGVESFFDIYLMSQCKHNICANSTFSFWGARLNGSIDKIMIRPSIHKNSQKKEEQSMKELWCKWVLLNREGMEI